MLPPEAVWLQEEQVEWLMPEQLVVPLHEDVLVEEDGVDWSDGTEEGGGDVDVEEEGDVCLGSMSSSHLTDTRSLPCVCCRFDRQCSGTPGQITVCLSLQSVSQSVMSSVDADPDASSG